MRAEYKASKRLLAQSLSDVGMEFIEGKMTWLQGLSRSVSCRGGISNLTEGELIVNIERAGQTRGSKTPGKLTSSDKARAWRSSGELAEEVIADKEALPQEQLDAQV